MSGPSFCSQARSVGVSVDRAPCDLQTCAMLELAGVDVTVSGLKILDGVTMKVPAGSITGLIGPNGAGKTTAFNVVSGFVRADAGTITFKGQSINRVKTHQLAKLGISRTLQAVGLFPTLTVLENVMLGATSRTKTGILSDSLALPWVDKEQRVIREKSLEMLRRFALDGVADSMPGELPYPTQKKVALARALVSEPDLLLLDEPAGGVGAEDIRELSAVLQDLTPECTVLLVEHHMELVMEVCDLIWVLDAGKIIASGTPAQIRSNQDVLAAYLGEAEVL
jgi:branched-chain amino acid transport system ATP-binding protein